MARGFGRVLAGAALGGIAGYGQGLAEAGAASGKAKRDAALLSLQQKGRIDLENLSSKNRRGELRLGSELTAGREEKKAAKGLIETKHMIVGPDGQLYVARKNPKTGKPDLISLGIKGRKFGKTDVPPVEVFDESGKSPTGTVMVSRKDAIGKAGKSQAKQVLETRRGDEEVAQINDRQEAERLADERAGYFSTDATDFPETGGDREAWITQEAERIGRERRARGEGAGAARPQTQKAATGRIYTLEEIKGMGRGKLKKGMKARAGDGKIYVWDGQEFQPEND